MNQDTRTIIQFAKVITVMSLLTVTGCMSENGDKKAQKGVSPRYSGDWAQEFDIGKRSLATVGENRYFVLKPGFQLVLEGENEKVAITVLDETKQIGGITTRVVEEREEKNGKLVEVSKNYFAICKDTGDVFYFGEDVDIYKDGKIVGHSGAWRADEKNSKAGLMMPGGPSPGAKYYQEIAPGKAMDRAEIVSMGETFKAPAGIFKNCLKTEETSALNPGEKGYKTCAPGIGLIQDEGLLLTHYGFLSLNR
jgi:hypothetical protein